MTKVNNLLFIGIAAALIGCNTPVENPNDKTPNGDSVPVRDVMTYVTTADGTMGFVAIGKDYAEGLNMSPERTLTLNPNVRYQEFDGFGAAITGAAAFNLMQMPAERREKLLVETFSPEKGMGYGYVRVPIGGSDFNSRSNYDYTCCDTKGIENFGLTSDEVDYIIPVLKEILAINPDLKVMGTPWSCPIWMKVDDIHSKAPYTGGNKWVGGYLNPDYYQDYAMYFVKWIKAFEAEGIHITSVTPQNEPLNWGNSMSLYMPWDQERDFIKLALGPVFKREGVEAKIICFDHNYNYDGKKDQLQYPIKIYADPEASQYIDGAAYHSYGGSPVELDAIHKLAPEKNLYFTEQSIGTWNYQSFGQSLMSEMKNICMGTVTRWCKTVIVWNFMLDENGGPHGGPGACATCYGAVDISSKDYTTLNKRSHYYVIGHLSKALKPGSTRIGVSGYMPTGLSAVASENPDGTYGLVLFNENTEGLTFIVEHNGKHFEIKLPAESITSCVL